jgi:hypothetical protein
MNRCRRDAATGHWQNIVLGLHATQWSIEMQYNNQSIAASCRFAKDMPLISMRLTPPILQW